MRYEVVEITVMGCEYVYIIDHILKKRLTMFGKDCVWPKTDTGQEHADTVCRIMNDLYLQNGVI